MYAFINVDNCERPLTSLYMLYVRGNNDTDDAEYYVNHLMFAFFFRELDGDTVLSFKNLHHGGCVMTGCDADGTVRKFIK